MRIAFDGTTLRPRRTGVGYYTEHLLQHVAREASGDELLLLSNRRVETVAPLPQSIRIVENHRFPLRILWMQLLAPHVLREIHPDVAHFTNGLIPLATNVPIVVTIHDMSLTLYPRYHPPRRVILNRPLANLAARRASAIITVSHSARRDILRLYKVAPERVHVIHEAAAPCFRRIDDRAALAGVRRRYGLADRIILYVGTIEPRKNLPRLIEAFARRRATGELTHQLVCVGPYGWSSRGVQQRIEQLGITRAVCFTGYVPFSDLAALYNASEMFVFPSLYEGFGLPVMEAMACGVPVITGGHSSLIEIAGGAVHAVDPVDTEALGDALVSLARSKEHRMELARRGLLRAQQFSWRRAAQETLEVYRAATRLPSPTAVPQVSRASGELGIDPLTSPAAVAGDSTSRSIGRLRILGSASHPVSHSDAFINDVLFGQAYYLRFDPKLWAAQQPYPPLGTLYAASFLRRHGYRVALFDAMLAASESAWGEALDRHRPQFAVIYEDSFNYLSKMCLLRMREAALAMIDMTRQRGIATIVSGTDATDRPEVYLDRGASFVVMSEGEATLRELLDVLTGKSPVPLDQVDGLCFRGADGTLRRTPARKFVQDLDGLPFPAWDLVDLRRYRETWIARHGYYSMNLVTTRGCPFSCNWCAKPIYGQRYVARSPENVVEEMVELKRKYGPDHLWIADDIFGLKPGWIERFAELVTTREAVIPFKCLLRADLVTDRVVTALAAAHCKTVWIGAESGSQRILDAMDKGLRVGQIYDAARLLHEAGIEVGFFLQFGYPGETREDIDRTRQMVRDCQPDDIGVSVSYPLPGTTFYDKVKAEIGEKQNWIDSDDLATMYRATYIPEFYRALHRVVHAEFRARRTAAELRRVAVRPWLVRRRHLRHAARCVHDGIRLPFMRLALEYLAQPSPMSEGEASESASRPQMGALPSRHVKEAS